MTLSETLHSRRYELTLAVILIAGLYARQLLAMAGDWYHDDNYSHGILVPFISGYFIYSRRNELGSAAVRPWNPGIAVIVTALVLLTAATVGSENFTARISLVFMLAGMVLYFFGTEIFRIIRMPIFYLTFMIPIPYVVYNAAALPLKVLISRISVLVLQSFGLSVVRDGTVMLFPNISLHVADACSGIRSLISIMALCTAYSFYLKLSRVNRWLLSAAAVVITVAANTFRVVLTGFLAEYSGACIAQGFFHEFSGIFIFITAAVMVLVLGNVLKENV